LQEHTIAENKQTNKQTKMIGNDNCEQKTLGLRNKIIIIIITRYNECLNGTMSTVSTLPVSPRINSLIYSQHLTTRRRTAAEAETA
jgi:nitrate reductase NapAB chaperone NapD